jgi:hypothetical protein
MTSVIGTEEDVGVEMVGMGRPRSLDRERSDLSEKMMMQWMEVTLSSVGSPRSSQRCSAVL